MKRRLEKIEESVERYLHQLDSADRQELSLARETKTARLQDKIATLKEEVQRLKALESEMLVTPDQQISLTDPDARSMATSGRGSGMVGYNVQMAVDTEHHLIVTHEVVREDLLRSVPGIGPNIARTLIAELPELGQIDRRSLAALAGLAPFNRDSGKLHGRRAIAGGRAPVRQALFMAVLVSIRRKLPLAETCHRLVDTGKPPKVAIVACMRKLLGILNAILRDQTPWQNA